MTIIDKFIVAAARATGWQPLDKIIVRGDIPQLKLRKLQREARPGRVVLLSAFAGAALALGGVAMYRAMMSECRLLELTPGQRAAVRLQARYGKYSDYYSVNVYNGNQDIDIREITFSVSDQNIDGYIPRHSKSRGYKASLNGRNVHRWLQAAG